MGSCPFCVCIYGLIIQVIYKSRTPKPRYPSDDKCQSYQTISAFSKCARHSAPSYELTEGCDLSCGLSGDLEGNMHGRGKLWTASITGFFQLLVHTSGGNLDVFIDGLKSYIAVRN